MATDPAIERAIERVRAAAALAVGDWAEYVLGEAVQQVPIEEATLQNSGTTAVDPDTLTGYVGFGRGAAAPYAIRQHEVPMRHDPGRKDHYLSDPVAASQAVALTILARRLRSVIGGVG